MEDETSHDHNSPDASTDAANALGGLVLILPVVFILGLVVGIFAGLKAGMEPIVIIYGLNLLVPGVIAALAATLVCPLGYLSLRLLKIRIWWAMFLGALCSLLVGWLAVFVVVAFY